MADYRLYKTIIMNHIASVREDMIAAVSIILSLMQDKQAEKLPRAVAWPAAAGKTHCPQRYETYRGWAVR